MKLRTEKILSEIKRLGWSKYRLAKEMKMANQTIYRILKEEGRSYTFKTVERFAKAIDVDPRDLIE